MVPPYPQTTETFNEILIYIKEINAT